MTRKEITDAFNSLSLDARKEYLEALKAESKTQYDNFIKDLSDQAVQDFWDNERELIKQGKGTRDWTIELQQTIMNIGKNGEELTHAPEKRTYVNKWTIQPEKLYHSILKTGKYICDPLQFNMPEFVEMYNWLVLQMKKRIGDPPEGVIYPVWAWHTQRSKRHKPDLRSERWANGYDGEKFVCLEIEVPDEQVLLSDFDLWSLILLDSIITETEEEDHKLTEIYKELMPQKQLEMKYKNWNRVFDVTPFENEWTRCGSWIQATFWVLTKDMIKKVRYFKAAKHCEQPIEK